MTATDRTHTPTATGDVLDTARLADLRRQRSLSRKELERAAGLSHGALARIETGDADALLTLTQLARLAAALGVTPLDLLTSRPAARSTAETDHSGGLTVETAQLLSLLLADGGVLSRDLVARSLGWDLRRLLAATARLEQQAPELGLEVVRRGFRLGVVHVGRWRRVQSLAAGRRPDEVSRSTKARTARLVHAVSTGDPDAATAPADALAEALGGSMLERDGDGRLVVTARVKTALAHLAEL